MKIQLSKTQWEHIGKTAGWLSKQANGWGRLSGDLTDVIEAQVIIGLRNDLNAIQIVAVIKSDENIRPLLREEQVTDNELLECVTEEMEMYRLTAKNNGEIKTAGGPVRCSDGMCGAEDCERCFPHLEIDRLSRKKKQPCLFCGEVGEWTKLRGAPVCPPCQDRIIADWNKTKGIEVNPSEPTRQF